MISEPTQKELAIYVWNINTLSYKLNRLQKGVYARIEPDIAAYMVVIKPEGKQNS